MSDLFLKQSSVMKTGLQLADSICDSMQNPRLTHDAVSLAFITLMLGLLANQILQRITPCAGFACASSTSNQTKVGLEVIGCRKPQVWYQSGKRLPLFCCWTPSSSTFSHQNPPQRAGQD